MRHVQERLGYIDNTLYAVPTHVKHKAAGHCSQCRCLGAPSTSNTEDRQNATATATMVTQVYGDYTAASAQNVKQPDAGQLVHICNPRAICFALLNLPAC